MFVALGIEPEVRVHHIAIVSCPTVRHFSTLSHKRHDFWNNVVEHSACVLIFSTTFVGHISHP